MPEFYQSECPFEGPQDPDPRTHMGLHFSIPRKCGSCQFYFEGGCRKITNRLVRLDYGFCGIEGSKELVSDPRAKRRIPLKCQTCSFLKENEAYRLICTKDQELWGECGRGLDY